MSAAAAPAALPLHVVVVPHTHWDREWYQPFQQFRARLVRMLDRLLDGLDDDPAFAHFHLDGQTVVLEDYLEVRPHARARLRRLIHAGRVAVGPWYVLPDEFLVSGESLIRNLQIGCRLAAGFGGAPRVGYLPDQFGHIAQMPQILTACGIDSAVLWRGVGADVQSTLFTWEGLDGSRLFTVYLPISGYSNGRSLPQNADALRRRLRAIIDEQAPFRRVPLLLLMNGTDHQEAQAFVPALLREVIACAEGLTYEIAPLARFIDLARTQPDGVDYHRGELRSPLRAHLLPGVTSMRIAQKQRDFANTARLERYAEPLATWADLRAGARRWTDFTEWAWRLAVHNHPHDSICGCSVDQVHRDMEYRFDQVQQVAEQTQRQAGAALVRQLDTSMARHDSAVVVFNPNHAGPTLVDADVEIDDPGAVVLEDAEGRPLPVSVDGGARETVFAAELTPDEARPHVLALQGREFLGYFVNQVGLRREADRLLVRLALDRVLRGRLDVEAVRHRWLSELDGASLRTVIVHAHSAPPARLRFTAPLAGHGFTVFAMRRGAAPAPVPIRERSVDTAFYRITIHDDGALTIADKDLGVELPRVHSFADEGDRGDEYNFDPVPDGTVVTQPLRPADISVEHSDVMTTIRIRTEYRLPCALAPDRERRAVEWVDVPIDSTVCVYAGVKRIDFDTAIDNSAADHRLRVHFPSPLSVRSAWMEQAFGVVERRLAPEPEGEVERAVGTVPQKTFTCISDGRYGVALFNRGIPEIEVRPRPDGAELALTLLRAVGWLSRGDLRWRRGHAGPGLETPAAQSLGPHRFQYALTTFAGNWVDAGVVQQAHAFAYPPFAMVADAHPGSLDPALVECDNPHVVLSAVTPARRRGAFLLRWYNSSDREQQALLRVPSAGHIRAVTLLERPARARLRRRAAPGWQLQLRPFEIVTLCVQPARAG